jgi:DNA-binding transcriptional ArsR family regulator
MDIRTANLLRALDATAVDLLAVLIKRPLSQKALLREVDGVSQSNAHKKLERLADAGLIRQRLGETGRGQAWEVVAPGPTANLLAALLSLSDALDLVDRHARRSLQDRLGVDPNRDHGLRLLDGRESRSGGTSGNF